MKEEKIIIGKDGKYPLNGILSLPENIASALPAVVLVHGSGSHDMDETILKVNKPFRDIGEYLPTKGIAVLRYNKRTFTYGRQMVKEKDFPSFTVKDETIQDALFAADLLRNDSRINPEKIFIIGHSLGGMLAPRVDNEGGNFAGLILMGSSPRSLVDIIISQQDDLLKQSGKLLQFLINKQFASFRKKFDAMANMTKEEAMNAKFAGPNRMWYLKELEDNPVAKFLLPLEKPVLIMQGEKDVQVTADKDFALYKEICAGKKNVEFKLYPGLNHLFMKSAYGTIKNIQKEYKIPGKMETIVMDDIAEFILKN
ncbi:MAG: lysophospholipase [Treponema sp.]|nr:lysophospholipase [Treponema sp.]